MKTASAPLPARAIHLQASALALLLVMACAMAAAAEHAPEHLHGAAYRRVRIVILYPPDESTVFDDGTVKVEIAVSPSRALTDGDRIDLRLDGREVRARHGEDFVLPELDGGLHYLRARLIDAGGKVVRHADPVQFYFWPAQAASR